MQQKIYDIIIAGAGPAGLTAAVYARRAGKSVLLIEKEAFGGQITLSPHVENYPFTRPMSGNELVEVLVEQVMNLGADVEVGAVVAVSENADKTVTVRTDYQEFTGRTLIIATGLKHRLPGAEGEQRFIGSGISFCAVCDGAFFKDKAVAVIGGGNTSIRSITFVEDVPRLAYDTEWFAQDNDAWHDVMADTGYTEPRPLKPWIDPVWHPDSGEHWFLLRDLEFGSNGLKGMELSYSYVGEEKPAAFEVRVDQPDGELLGTFPIVGQSDWPVKGISAVIAEK